MLLNADAVGSESLLSHVIAGPDHAIHVDLNQRQPGLAAGGSSCADISPDGLAAANSAVDPVGEQASQVAEPPVLFTLDLSSPAQATDPGGDSIGSFVDVNSQGAEPSAGLVDGSLCSSFDDAGNSASCVSSDLESPVLQGTSPRTSPRGPPRVTPPVCNQIVFIDSAVYPDFQLKNTEIPGVAVIVLDGGQDGIRQISDVLSSYHNLSAIHILSHGAPGQVNLGTAKLTLSTLNDYATDLAAWGRSLAEDGDILFYGCSVAQGQAGMDLIDRVAGITKADVAASNDPTGAASLGGNWVLEDTTGPIQSPALSPVFSAGFDGLLAAGDLDTTFGTPGILTTPIGSGHDYGYSVALQSDGKIVVAGFSYNGSNDDFALIRYNSNRSLDTTFGTGGKVTTPISSSNED